MYVPLVFIVLMAWMVFQLPAPKDFLWQYVYSTPLAGLVSDAGDEVLNALEQDVVAKWQEFEYDGGMRYEQRMLLGRALK